MYTANLYNVSPNGFRIEMGLVGVIKYIINEINLIIKDVGNIITKIIAVPVLVLILFTLYILLSVVLFFSVSHICFIIWNGVNISKSKTYSQFRKLHDALDKHEKSLNKFIDAANRGSIWIKILFFPLVLWAKKSLHLKKMISLELSHLNTAPSIQGLTLETENSHWQNRCKAYEYAM